MLSPSPSQSGRTALSLEERAARSAKALERYYAQKPRKEFDANLTKPQRFVAPPTALHPAERARLESERTCLQRELVTVQRGLDYLNGKLAA